jgi:uncharacterized protein (TIGR02466 family)
MLIHQLFPEPLYFSKLERALTNEELKTINKYKKKTKKNIGNSYTTDNYILKHKTLNNLKKDLTKMVIDYFNKVVCSSNSITPYITQSWLNYTEPAEYHHAHSHFNSYASGVFYINAQQEVDRIKFYKTHQPTIQLNTIKNNIFNSKSCWYSVQTGDVILFPSTLMHGVDKKKGTNTRVSLSFNVFMKGKIGNNPELTELVLK